jgi:hypothetical protein
MQMSQMDSNSNTSVTDTLKLRNTETAALKRMPLIWWITMTLP